MWKQFKNASKDIKLLWLSVFTRLLAYGLTNQILTLFLNKIVPNESYIGIFMSLTLVGDVLASYVLTWYADSWGRRRVLILGSIMMFVSGIVFTFSESYWCLLLFAILGVISPSSNEVGPFKSIEESMIAHLSENSIRPEVYAIHSLVGTTGAALGAILSGSFVNWLQVYWQLDDLHSYKYTFALYAMLALIKIIIMCCLSSKTELDSHFHNDPVTVESITTNDMAPLLEQCRESIHEQTPLINNNSGTTNKNSTTTLSKESIHTLLRLLVIFMMDSFGSGFMTDGWMVYYFKYQFELNSIALGTLFFITTIVMASSTLPSSVLPRWFGPVKATLLVQIPSGIFSILLPFVSNSLVWSIILLNLHFSTTAMDVTSRQILLTNLIPAKDLTKVMGIVNIGKTFARCIGPIFTGILAKNGYLWFCYIISGSLVILADIILAISFLHVDKLILQQINGSN